MSNMNNQADKRTNAVGTAETMATATDAMAAMGTIGTVASNGAVTPVKVTEVAPLNYQAALASFTPEEQKEITDLAESIDVRKIENVMHYGDAALKMTFDQCGEFLKDERGSQADQEVIKQVIDLSKRANASYDDFNLVLKEPNLLQKVFLAITSGGKKSRTDKITNSAITNYKLLFELRKSCDEWLDILTEAMGQITESSMSDVETAGLLEKYIIAGKLAEERVKNELVLAEKNALSTGLQKDSQDYEELKEGYNIFALRMNNLEKSRVMYCLSLGQLALIKRGNRNVQISIHTQMENSMALMGQQLRNAVLNAKTKEVMEGQKLITRLNDELIKEVSKSVGFTAEESEKLIYAGFYNTEAAKEAVKAVISSCQAIQKTAEEMLPQMKADVTELNGLINELSPYVASINSKTLDNVSSAPTTVGTTKKTGNNNKKLTF